MTSAERRKNMVSAVESGSEQALVVVVQLLVDVDIDEQQLLEDLNHVRTLVGEAQEELVLDVMDRVVGWCAPAALIRRSEAND